MRILGFQFCLALVLGLPLVGAAQEPIGNKTALYNAYETNALRRNALFTGEEQAKKEDLKFAQATAEWYVYRLTHPRTTFKNVDLVNEFSIHVDGIVSKNVGGKPRENRVFIEMYGPELVKAMKEVLARDMQREPQVHVQAALLLPIMARLQQNDIGNYLVELVKNKDGKTHDVVRHFAIKAMREYFPVVVQDQQPNFFDARVVARMRAEAKYVDAITQFIERSVQIEGLTSREIDALRFIRREAIISLSQAGAPAVVAFTKPEKIGKEEVSYAGLVAPTLLKVLANQNMVPEPSLQEKVEAAIGLCNLKYPNMDEYNPQVAVYLVGKTLQQLRTEYNKDLENFGTPNLKEKKLPLIAWKTDAKRFEAGLAHMREQMKNRPNAQLAKDLEEISVKPLLIRMNLHKSIDNADRITFDNTLTRLKPADGKVFKTLKLLPIELNPQAGPAVQAAPAN